MSNAKFHESYHFIGMKEGTIDNNTSKLFVEDGGFDDDASDAVGVCGQTE